MGKEEGESNQPSLEARVFTRRPLPAALMGTSNLSLFRFFYPLAFICFKKMVVEIVVVRATKARD